MARKKTVKSETTDLAQPQNRTEEFLAKIAGLVDTLPQGEFSRLERYLKYIAENGGGGGGGVTSFNTRTGAVTPESGDYSEFYAPITADSGEPVSKHAEVYGTVVIQKCGCVGYLNVNVYNRTNTIAAETVTDVLTLPTGFRPSARVIMPIADVDANSSAYRQTGYAVINTNGIVQIYLPTQAPIYIDISAAYFI